MMQSTWVGEMIPGLVDIQINGYRGVDFSSPDLTEREFVQACKDIVQNGTPAFLPTIITSSMQTYQHNLGVMNRALGNNDTGIQAHVLGVMLTGHRTGFSPCFRCI